MLHHKILVKDIHSKLCIQNHNFNYSWLKKQVESWSVAVLVHFLSLSLRENWFECLVGWWFWWWGGGRVVFTCSLVLCSLMHCTIRNFLFQKIFDVIFLENLWFHLSKFTIDDLYFWDVENFTMFVSVQIWGLVAQGVFTRCCCCLWRNMVEVACVAMVTLNWISVLHFCPFSKCVVLMLGQEELKVSNQILLALFNQFD